MEQQIHSTSGKHILVDAFGVDFDKLNNMGLLIDLLTDIAEGSSMTIVNIEAKQFKPQGVTVLGLLEESHISCHSYPESGYIAFDCFTCGPADAFTMMLQQIEKALNPDRISAYKVLRGNLETQSLGVDGGKLDWNLNKLVQSSDEESYETV